MRRLYLKNNPLGIMGLCPGAVARAVTSNDEEEFIHVHSAIITVTNKVHRGHDTVNCDYNHG